MKAHIVTREVFKKDQEYCCIEMVLSSFKKGISHLNHLETRYRNDPNWNTTRNLNDRLHATSNKTGTCVTWTIHTEEIL